MSEPRAITIIGAGLAGSLLAILLARRGWQVDVFERRGDPRVKGYTGGRSINLALAERGLHALRIAESSEDVLRQAVMMRGRMVHPLGGEPQLQRYGRDDSEVIWSINRGELNIVLLGRAEAAGARIHFDRTLDTVDFDSQSAIFRDQSGDVFPHDFIALVGADGAGSTLRAQMARQVELGERTEFLDHGYKELEIPPDVDGGFKIEPNALHIWPRGRYMCIALPNDERTFTVTLFMPNRGDPGFDTVRTGEQARRLFERDFPDTIALIPRLEQDYAANPVGILATLYLDQWHVDGRAVLIGDAAHAMVPFHGQGMNCAFEDCVSLAEKLAGTSSTAEAFIAFEAERKPNATAIQAMALENYLEMRDRVDDPDFLLQRDLERILQERHPGRFIPHYTMVTFMLIPYATAHERSEQQRRILVDATTGHQSLETIDLDAVDAIVVARLSRLQGEG